MTTPIRFFVALVVLAAGFQRDVETEFLTKLRPALDQVAKDRSLWLVFNEDTGVIAWANPAFDITGDVVKRIDHP